MGNFFGRLQIVIDEKAGGKHTIFAKTAGIPASTFQSYLSERIPVAEHLIRISETYRVSIDWLLTGEGEPYFAEEGDLLAKMPESSEMPGAPIDMDFLKDVIEVVERVLSKHQMLLEPPDKAEAITILYEMYMDTGKKPEERTAERILRLAA